MNTEEKAKAYDEAVERAKDCLTDKRFCETEDTIRSVMEYIFPQLAESENGKIIRLLRELGSLDAAKELYEEFNLSYTDVLYWLEKQKELPFVKDVVLGYPGHYFYDGERMHFCGNPAMEEKQKEQKPLKVEMTDFEQSVYDLCPVLGIEEAKATASDLLELAKKTLLKTGKVVLASNYPEGCSFEDGFHLGYNEGFNAKQKEQKSVESHKRNKLKESWLSRAKYEIEHADELLIQKQEELREIRELKKKEQKPKDTTLSREDCLHQLFENGTITMADYLYLTTNRRKQKLAEKQDYSGLNDLERAIHRGFLSAGVESVPVTIIKETAKECLAQMKPAEWSEEDEGELQNAIDALEFLGKKGVYKSESGYNAALQAASWLKNITERFNLQPKEEWSEVELEFRGEKVKIKRPFFRDDKGRGYSTTEQDEEVAWNALCAWCEKKGISLYDLYPKVEWSEEDADILNCCISSIEEAKENRYAYKETDGDTSYDREIDWLKSLRPVSKESLQPHWKPSEEQMDRLFSIVAALRKDYCDDMADFLASIYHNLKKLM